MSLSKILDSEDSFDEILKQEFKNNQNEYKETLNSYNSEDLSEVLLYAPVLIGHLDNPSEEHQLLVTDKYPHLITCIKKPTEKVIMNVITKDIRFATSLYISELNLSEEFRNKIKDVVAIHDILE